MARLLDAGADARRALESMREVCDGRISHAIQLTAQGVGRGMTLCAAGTHAGLWARTDEELLRAAERGGATQFVLERLALRYEARDGRMRRLQARLLMPLFVLCAGILLMPLPALFGAEIDIWGYLVRTMGPLVAILGTLIALRRFARLAQGQLWPPLASLLFRLPVLGSVLRQAARAETLDTLATLLEAGLPAVDAVELAARGAACPRLRARFVTARADLERGASVSAALRSGEWIDERQGYPLILAAEEAGRLAPGLFQYVGQLRSAAVENFDSIANWGAKAVYLAVLVVVAAGIVEAG